MRKNGFFQFGLVRTGCFIGCVALFAGGASEAIDATGLSERIRREVAETCLVSIDEVHLPSIAGLARRIPETEIPTLRVAGEEPCAEAVPVVLEWRRASAERVVVKARIRKPSAIAVAVRDIQRGEEVQAEDVRLESRHVTRAMQRAMADPEAVVGKRARRRIGRGAALRSAWVESVPVVSRGERVRLLFSIGDLAIESVGRAEEDAAQGETLRAINLESKKRIVGRVERAGVVRVDF